MGVKATDFGSILIEKHVGFRGELRFPETFLPTKQVGAGTFGRNAGDNFGYSVSIDGMLAAVGVPAQDYNEDGELSKADAGAVFVYRRNRDSWEFAYKISAPEADREEADNFGYSVSLKGNVLVVGSPKHAVDAAQANPIIGGGAAFVYNIVADAFELEAKLVPAVRDEDDNFGSVVSAFKDIVYVGSHAHGRNELEALDAPAAGAVWAFARNSETASWSLTKKIVAGGNDRNPNDQFGSAVSAHKNILAVGVPNYDYISKGMDLKTNAGAVYVFEWNTDHWVYRSLIVAADRAEGDQFGSAISVFDKRIAIGAPGKNKVYVYAQDILGNYVLASTAAPTMPVLADDLEQPTSATLVDGAKFGQALSLNADTLVVGAPNQRGLTVVSIDPLPEDAEEGTLKTWTGSETPNVGYVYVYAVDADSKLTQINKFTSVDRLEAGHALDNGNFGSSVSVGTDIIVVGEPNANVGSAGTDYKTNAGTAHIYVRTNGTFAHSKTVEGFYVDRNDQDAFATAFAQNDRFMVFTAPGQDYDTNNENYVSNAGAAYVWENVAGTWTYRQKLAAADRFAEAAFGSNVEILGETLFIQAARPNSSGAVHVFALENGAFVEKQRIVHADALAGDMFGSVMLARDSRLFIASTTVAANGTNNHGAVFAYNLVDGLYEFASKIVPTTLQSASRFGSSLSLNNNLLAVGAPGHSTDSGNGNPLGEAGAVFLFTPVEAGWEQVAKIAGPGTDRNANDYMGFAVARNANMIAVGIPGANYDAGVSVYKDSAGKVQLFSRDGMGWKLEASLDSPNRSVMGSFGHSVAMSDTRIVVGAPGEPEALAGTYGTGLAYVWEKVAGEWAVVATLSNDEMPAYDRRFGFAVAIDGDRVIVGEPNSRTTSENSTVVAAAGAAWIFEKKNGSWNKVSKLTAQALAGRTANANFGFSVDIRGTMAVVGAPYDTTNDVGAVTLANAGSTYVFRRAESSEGVVSWNPEKKLAGWAQDRNTDDRFGSAIAAYGNWVVVGATGHDFDLNRENFVDNAGALFVYEWVNRALVYRQKLVAHNNADRVADTGFGSVVAINSFTIVASAPNLKSATSQYRGKVWTWKLENGAWVKDRTFVCANSSDRDSTNTSSTTRFGSSLALSDTVLAIGSPASGFGATSTHVDRAGAVEVYRFVENAWAFEKTLVSALRKAGDEFGTTIAVRDNLIVVGGIAPQSSTPSLGADTLNYGGGAAWVFQQAGGNWNLIQKLSRGDEAANVNQFGTAVRISGDTMVVGAPGHVYDVNGRDFKVGAGAAYVFKMTVDGWKYNTTLHAPDRAENQLFGTDVVVKDDLIWVGAPGALNGGVVSGAVYGFRRATTGVETRRTRRVARFVGTGANQTFTVPAGIEEVTAYIWGAGGAVNTSVSDGGNGGFVRVKIPVTPGEELTLAVGTSPAANTGAGGGRSEILRGASTLAVAGGGGGTPGFAHGGVWVGTAGSAGANGSSGTEAVLAGLAGTSNAGGLSRTSTGYLSGNAGLFKMGGNGPTYEGATYYTGGWPNGGSSTVGANSSFAIGGGGDGWYGGSAGAVDLTASYLTAPAGGGSSYIAPGLTGYMGSVKTEYDDAFAYLSVLDNTDALASRPAVVNRDGMVVVEWYETYESNDWTFEQRLNMTTKPINANLEFGKTLAFDGATLVVGSPGDIHSPSGVNVGFAAGSAAVYEFNGFEWQESAVLFQFGLNSYANVNAMFTHSISVHEDYIIIGAPNHSYDEAGAEAMNGAGIAYLYRKVAGAWTNVQRLGPLGSQRNSNDLIGHSILSQDDWVFVGIPGQEYDAENANKVTNAGAVNVWKWEGSTLTFKQKLTAPFAERKLNKQFGWVLDYVDGQLYVSSPGSLVGGTENLETAGSLNVFGLEGDTWVPVQTINPPFSAPGSTLFGYDFAVSQDALAITAPGSAMDAISLANLTWLAYRPQGDAKYITLQMQEWSVELSCFRPDSSSATLLSTETPTGPGSLSLNAAGFGSLELVVSGVKRGETLAFGTNAWNRVIIQRSGNTMSFHVNGTQVASWEITGPSDVPYGLGAGIILGNTAGNADSEKRYEYIRVNTEALIPAEAFDDNMGRRPSTIMYANFRSNYLDIVEAYAATPETRNISNVPTFALIPGKTSSAIAGQVHFYKRDNGVWSYDQSVQPSGPVTAGDRFGHSVDLVEDFMVVGSPIHNLDQSNVRPLSNSGAVWFFQRVDSSWVQQQKLSMIGDEMVNGEETGATVESAGNVIAVAATRHPYDDQGENFREYAGAVYVWRFENDTWVIEQKIVASNRQTRANFGYSIAITDTLMVIGAPSNDDATKPGQAFVYRKEAGDTGLYPWKSEGELIAPGTNDRKPGDKFGYAVAINSDNEVMVGAPLHDFNAAGANELADAGAIFVFKKDTSWTLSQKLTANAMHKGVAGTVGRAAGEQFGSSITTFGNDLIVGQPFRANDARGQMPVSQAGGAIVFTRDNADALWEQTQIIVPQMRNSVANEYVGNAVSGWGDIFVAGSPMNNYDGDNDNYMQNAGAVYVWQKQGSEWKNIQKIAAVSANGINRQSNAFFGASLILHEDMLIVGAPQTTQQFTVPSTTNEQVGAVFIYKLVDGKFEFQYSFRPDASASNYKNYRFGYSLDYDGSTLIVGANNAAQTNTALDGFGRAYFFELNEEGVFEQTGMVVPKTAPAQSMSYGTSVSVHGDLAVASSSTALSGGHPGRVVIMQRIEGTWAEVDMVLAQDQMADSGSQFGFTIEFSADNSKMFVGAPNTSYDRLNRLVSNGGAVFFFENDNGTWVFRQRITPVGQNYHHANSQFGYSISYNNELGLLFVGAPGNTYNGIGNSIAARYGAVFEFNQDEDGFFYTKSRILPDPAYGMNGSNDFGYKIHSEANMLLASAPGNTYGNLSTDPAATAMGGILAFRLVDENWLFIRKIIPEGRNTAVANRRFGEVFKYKDSLLAVGVPNNRHDEYGTDLFDGYGSVFVYKVESLDALTVEFVGGKFNAPANATIGFNEDGQFDAVELQYGGDAYRDTPTIEFSAAGFAAHAFMNPVGLANPSLTRLGSGTPTVTVVNDPLDTTGAGAELGLTRAGSTIGSVSVTAPGSGYTDVPAVEANGGTNVSLRAVLKPTSISEVTIGNRGAGYTDFPTVQIEAPQTAGQPAQAHIVMEVDNMIINQTTKSYPGETFNVDFNGNMLTRFKTATVDAESNMLTVEVVIAGEYNKTTVQTGRIAHRVVENRVYGHILDFAPGVDEDYGLITESVYEADDYGSITDTTIVVSEDYNIATDAPSYGPITEEVVEYMSFGPITATPATVSVTGRLKTFTLDNAGTGFTRRPTVALVGTSSVPAQLTAVLTPTEVASVEVVNGGYNVPNGVSVEITGGNGTGATAVPNIQLGVINGLYVINAGSGYTRTPKVEFSIDGFAGKVELQPTTVASVVTTEVDETLNVEGRLTQIKRLSNPINARQINSRFGTAIAGSGSTVAISGLPAVADNIPTSGGNVEIFEVQEREDRVVKVEMDGWLNASSAMAGLSDFTLSMWYRTSDRTKVKNNGTMFAATDPTRPGLFESIRSTTGGSFTVPANVNKIRFQGWGAGSKKAARPDTGGFAGGILDVTPGESFGWSMDTTTGRTRLTRGGVEVANIGSGINDAPNGFAADPLVSNGNAGGWNLASYNPNFGAIYVQGHYLSGVANMYDAANFASGYTGTGVYNMTGHVSTKYGIDNRMIRFYYDSGTSRNGSSDTISSVPHIKSVYVSKEFSRFVDTFKNNGTADITFNVVSYVAIGETYGYTTGTFNTARMELGTQDGTTKVVILNGDGQALLPVDISNMSVRSPMRAMTWTITLKPGETKSIATFYVCDQPINGVRTAASAAATALLPNLEALFYGLTNAEIATIANFKFARENEYATTADPMFSKVYNGATGSPSSSPMYDGVAGTLNNPGLVTVSPVVDTPANRQSLQITNNGKINVSTTRGEVSYYTSPMEDGWHNIVYTVSAEKASVYIDGNYQFTVDVDSLGASDIVALGAKFDQESNLAENDTFAGYLADVAVWNTSLTEEEVQMLLTAKADTIQPGNIRAYWLKN